MRTFKEMLDSTSNEELGRMMRDRFERLAEAHSMGLTDTHPATAWNNDNATLRRHRVTKDAGGSGLGARELEESDQPRAQDDPPRTPGTPQPPERNGGELAAHDAALRVAIPGLDRFTAGYRGPKVDEDGIVQSPRSW